MPGRSGLEVLTSLRETHSAIKVLVVSMYPEDQYALRCLKAGAQGYANKAGDPVELIAAVRTVMQGTQVPHRRSGPDAGRQFGSTHAGSPSRGACQNGNCRRLVKIASGRRLVGHC